MRNALVVLVFSGILSVFGFEQSKGADAPPPSLYASSVSDNPTIPQVGESGLLPIRAGDHLQLPVVELNGRPTVAADSVEAIPTPTAFHAGAALLSVILLSRFLRKVRWA